ncbi:hypothetical protein D9M72_101620 [compost metagenome]
MAARQRVTPQTVSKWRARFVEQRLDGLLDAPRPGTPRSIDDARVDAVIAKTIESVNQVERWFATLTEKYIRRGTHRSTRQLERAIRQCLDAHNANPKPFMRVARDSELCSAAHKAEGFLISGRGRRRVSGTRRGQPATGHQKTVCAEPLRRRACLWALNRHCGDPARSTRVSRAPDCDGVTMAIVR